MPQHGMFMIQSHLLLQNIKKEAMRDGKWLQSTSTSTTSNSGTLLVYPLGRKWLYAIFRVKYLKSGSEQLFTNKFESGKKLENSSIHALCGD